MTSQVRTRPVLKAARVLAPPCVMLVAIVTLAAECKIFKLELPETDTLALNDGERVLGSTTTEAGKFEARVTVRARVVSPPRFYIRGKLMTATPEAQIPPELRECLRKTESAALPNRGWLANLLPSLRDWIETPTHAYKCKTVILGCVKTIGGWICCAKSTCGGSSATACGSA